MRVAASEPELAPAKPIGVTVRRPWQKHVLSFLMVFGPGLIVMEADNDAGAVSTYMQAGGQYGLHLLWTLIAINFAGFVLSYVPKFEGTEAAFISRGGAGRDNLRLEPG